jgi:hypothetical protein
MQMKALVSVLSGACLGAGLLGCGSGSPEPNFPTVVHTAPPSPVHVHLDCGKGTAGSERALRQFSAILRQGNQLKIRAALIDRPRFFAVSANGRPGPSISVRGDPGTAAQVIAANGGLPVRIDRFMNSEGPSRNTDFGFRGRWNGTRKLIGKAAIDCTQGKVIAFNVGVHGR